jgi:hypothetical protein
MLYWIIGILLIISFTGSLFFRGSYIGDLSLNIVAETFGMGVTVFIIEEYFRKRENKEKQRYLCVLYNQLKSHLQSHVYMLFILYFYTTKDGKAKGITDVNEFFKDHYFSEVKYLNFQAMFSECEGQKWWQFIQSKLFEFIAFLDKTIDKYSSYMSSTELSLFESIISSDFVRKIQSVAFYIGLSDDKEFDFINSNENDFRQYIRSIIQLINIYNGKVGSEGQIDIDKDWWELPFGLGSCRVSKLTNWKGLEQFLE